MKSDGRANEEPLLGEMETICEGSSGNPNDKVRHPYLPINQGPLKAFCIWEGESLKRYPELNVYHVFQKHELRLRRNVALPSDPELAIPNTILNEAKPRECRICYELDNPNNMASPCECSGSIKFVHKTCLGNWINSSKSTRCSMCLRDYNNTVKIERTYRHLTLWNYFMEDGVPASEFAIMILGICQIIYCLNAAIYGHLLVFVWLVSSKMNVPTLLSLNPLHLISSVAVVAEHASSSSSSSTFLRLLSTLGFVIKSSYGTQLGILLWILDVVVIFGMCVGLCVIWDVVSEYKKYLQRNFIVTVRW